MFTGIVQDIGEVIAVDKSGDWTVTIRSGKIATDHLVLGASVACGGICLTVIDILPQSRLREAQSSRGEFKVQISAETLSKTTSIRWQKGSKINLETALRVGDELGGHIMTGHVDGIASVTAKHRDGDSIRFQFDAPQALSRFIASKGSVAIDGVSLTVNEVEGTRFGVNIIPFTQAATTLGSLEPGAEANMEVDMMARYADRLLATRVA